jgi:hypothetical protein
MLLQIILRTPTWVWALFAFLFWQGLKLTRPNSTGLVRVTLVPVVMVCLSIYGTISAFGGHPDVLVVWLAAATTASLVLLKFPLPQDTLYDAAKKRVHQSGSLVPLALMMGIFFTKYGVGVSISLHPALTQEPTFFIAVSALSGAFSGVFAARALRLHKRLLTQRDPW